MRHQQRPAQEQLRQVPGAAADTNGRAGRFVMGVPQMRVGERTSLQKLCALPVPGPCCAPRTCLWRRPDWRHLGLSQVWNSELESQEQLQAMLRRSCEASHGKGWRTDRKRNWRHLGVSQVRNSELESQEQLQAMLRCPCEASRGKGGRTDRK